MRKNSHTFLMRTGTCMPQRDGGSPARGFRMHAIHILFAICQLSPGNAKNAGDIAAGVSGRAD